MTREEFLKLSEEEREAYRASVRRKGRGSLSEPLSSMYIDTPGNRAIIENARKHAEELRQS